MESEAKIIIAECVLAIQYYHNMNIIYGGLVPENIMLDEDGHCYLKDVIMINASKYKDKKWTGFPIEYLPPEFVMNSGYDQVWIGGV